MIGKRPGLSKEAIPWLDSILHTGMNVLEYGSGDGSAWIARRVGRLISIESSPWWYKRVCSHLEGIKGRHEVCLALPEERGEELYRSQDGKFYTSYAKLGRKKAQQELGSSVNLVMIDGRGRMGCVHEALAVLKRGGYLVLDDADRPRYAAIDQKVKNAGLEESCFFSDRKRMTRVWRNCEVL